MEIKTTKLSKISNIIFAIFATSIITFIWINFYLRNIKLSMIYSLIFSLIIISIIYLIKYFTQKKNIKVLNIEKNKSELKFKLQFSKRKLVNNYILDLLKFNHAEQLSSNHFYNHKTNQDIFIYLNDNINSEIYNDSLSYNIIIITLDNTNFQNEINEYTIEIINFNKLYDLSIQNNIYPNFNITKAKPTKYKLNNILENVLTKHKSKKLFLIGITILISSLFTKYNIYYIIMSTILMLLSVYARFNKKYN